MIRIIGLNKFYRQNNVKKQVLKDISLDLPNTGLIYIHGESGTGKTTLINILGGIDTNYQGEIIIDGKSMSAFSKSDYNYYRNNYVGTIFQSYNLINELNVYENIELVLKLQNNNKMDIKNKIDEILEMVGLSGFQKRNIQTLSGGQAQRVAIARCLVKQPKLILADEITANLDTETEDEIMSILEKMSKQCLIIMVTHNKSLQERYKGKLLVLEEGSINTNVSIDKNEIVEPFVPVHTTTPLTLAFKIIFRSILNQKITHTLLILLLTICLTVVGFTIEESGTDETDLSLVNMIDNGAHALEITADHNSRFDHLPILKSKPVNNIISPSKTQVVNFMSLYINELSDHILMGTPPTQHDEVLITDVTAKQLSENYEDAIGMTISYIINNTIIPLKITGIISTNYNELNKRAVFSYNKSLVELNNKLFYSHIFVTDSFYNEYRSQLNSIEGLITLEDEVIYRNFNKQSDNTLLIGNLPKEHFDLIIPIHDIPIIFPNYDTLNIEENIDTIFQSIKSQKLKINLFNRSEQNIKNYDLNIVGVSSHSYQISESLLYELTNYQPEESLAYFINNDFKSIKKDLIYLKDMGADITLISHNDLYFYNPNYNKINNFIQILRPISIFISLIAISVFIITTFFFIQDHKRNIFILYALGVKQRFITFTFFIRTFLLLLISGSFSIGFIKYMINWINHNMYLVTYNLFVNRILFTDRSIIFIASTILIPSVISFIYASKLFYKEGK